MFKKSVTCIGPKTRSRSKIANCLIFADERYILVNRIFTRIAGNKDTQFRNWSQKKTSSVNRGDEFQLG